VFDLSRDSLCPSKCLTLLSGRVASTSLAWLPALRGAVAFVLADDGTVYCESLARTAADADNEHLVANMLPRPAEVTIHSFSLHIPHATS